MKGTVLLAATAVTVLAVALTAGQQAPPAPTAATIRGAITDSSGASPSGLFVIVFPVDETRWSGPASDARVKRVAVTDGRFEVTGLPPTEYKLTFATEAMLAGWPSPAALTRLNANKPVPIRLAVGETVGFESVVTVSPDGVTMSSTSMSRSTIETEIIRSRGSSGPSGALPPGRGRPAGPPARTAPGAISGRVTDADAKPVAGIEVRTMVRRTAANGTVQFLTSTSAVTDADGRYRVANRGAADYLVLAQAYSNETNALGAQVLRVPPPVAATDGRRLGYISTFHGGALDPSRAIVVTVATEERADINISLVRAPVWNMTGKVSGRLPVSGAPAMVIVSPVDLPDTSGLLRTRRVPIAVDGTFEVTDMPEGEYLFSVSNFNGWAEARLRVAGRPPDPITLTMQPQKTLAGRVEFQGSTPAPVIPPLGMRPEYMVELRPAQLPVGGTFNGVPVQPDGTFSIRGSGPGPFRLQGVAPAPWVPIAGFVNGIDTLDIPQPLNANVESATIILADRQTALLVKVTDDADRPVEGVGVVVFSEDPRYWPVKSRRVQSGITMPGGGCAMSNLPPGKYFVVASHEVALNTNITPEVIDRLKARALPFELAAAESRVLQVRVR